MLGRGGLSIPGLIADKLRCCRASYLQIPSQAALAECLWPHRGRWVSLIRRAGAQLAKGRRAHTSVLCTGKEQRLLSSPRGTMCVGLIRETPFAIQMNEGFGVRNAVSKQESVVQEPGCGYSPAPPPVPCSSLISLPWRLEPGVLCCFFAALFISLLLSASSCANLFGQVDNFLPVDLNKLSLLLPGSWK